MSAVVTALLNGVPVPLELTDEQLADLAAALPVAAQREARREWMSVEGAARYLDCTVERVRKLKDRGRIPFYQEAPNCRVFFRRSDLDDWLESFRHGGEAQTTPARR